ncbi:MAG: riboflavin biosynthesis protein RibF [bacterium]|nr:riboflavin biosynthesis protein RibF [bacterium]
MRLIEGLDALLALDLRAAYGNSLASRSVVAVGVFDGVHLGHQRLLHQLLEMSSALEATPTVVTFENHPDQVLRGEAPPLIASVPHRLRLLRRAGVQRLVLLQFEERLRNLPARDFAERILQQSLRARGLLLGYDSAMGRNREGTPQRFRELGSELGFEVRTGSPFEVDSRPVSSTQIRNAIANGDLEAAQRYLGRSPGAFGKVVHGADRGKSLGFPTANVAMQPAILPPDGVYAVEAILDGKVHLAVANLGPSPTFDADRGLEVHLLDFAGDLYDRELEVLFRQQLRQVQKFENATELQQQIARDVDAARRCLTA